MKKIISVILIFTLLCCFSLSSVFAQGKTFYYTDEEKEFIYLKYSDQEHMFETLFNSDTSIGYWKMVNSMENHSALKWSIDAASKIIGVYPDKQDYTEILANLIAMQNGSIAEQVQNQSQYDNLKDGIDYGMDIVEIASNFIGGANLLESINPIIDAVTGGAEVIIDNVEQAKYYETSIKDYAQAKMFLEAVSLYAQNEELRSAASVLLKANNKLLEKRLEYLADSSATLAEYEAEFFVKNMSYALLKTTDIYHEDETVKWYVDYGEKISNSIDAIFSAGKFVFNTVMLAGDIGFGTTDTFNRYQEMKIVSDIAGAIVEANSRIIIPQETKTINDSVLTDIQTKCDYYKMLIICHARGEYLLYQLLINDAGLLSEFTVLFDYYKEPADTTDSLYERQVECLIKYYNILNDIFNVENYRNETSANNLEYLVGSWSVDPQKTEASNSLSLQEAFGTGLRYGNQMILNEDGTASWGIGIGNGGEGTYTMQNTTGRINYLDYTTNTESSVSLCILEEFGKLYIVMEYNDYILYWIKEAEPEKISEGELFEEHNYKFFTIDSVKTWEDAENYCENLGGHLAIITSSEENDFLYQMMTNAGYTSAYFGITDSRDEGKWIWVDGTEPSFTNWHYGEPNSENSNEDYGMFYWKYTDGTWNDGDFGKETNEGGTTFICEWNN